MSYVIDMDYQDKNGSTKRQSLMQVIQTTPETSAAHQSALEELSHEPELPFYLQHIWDWFWELNARRTSGGYSQNPITWSDFGYWNSLKQYNVQPIEIEILEILDRLYLKYIHKKSDKGKTDGNIRSKKPKKR